MVNASRTTAARFQHRTLVMLFGVLPVVSSTLFVSPSLSDAAQRATSADVSDGAVVFRGNCATCHGPDGNDVAGIDFGRGIFRRPLSDSDLVQIIRNGLPGTAMPASSLSEQQASRVVAYLRSMTADVRASAGTGVAERGRTVFEGKGQCLSCHRVKGRGGRTGPDLSDIGSSHRAAELERSITDPNAEIAATNRFYRVTMKDGTTVTGRLLNLDTFSVQLLDTSERLRSFDKAALRDYGFADGSPMPTFRDKLSREELADLVSYLTTLKGKVTP